MSKLTLEALSAQVADMSALKSVSFDVEPGETVAVVGPPESGKKTLMHVLAGLASPSSGRIMMGGRDITGLPGAQRPFGVILQREATIGHMSVLDHLSAGLSRSGFSGADGAQRVDRMIELLELSHLARRPLASLDIEQYPRVALARALVEAPGLLLLDDCSGRCDANAHASWRASFRRIRRELAQTTLMVTSDAEDAVAMADRLVVMDAGRVRQLGPVHDLYHYPCDAFVACSVGRCNLVPGEYTGHGRFRSVRGLELPCAFIEGAPHNPSVLAIRPENIDIGPPMGGMRAKVTDVTFLGPQIEYGLDLNGHPLFAVAPARASGIPELQPGASVDVSWALHTAQPLSV